MSIFEYDEEKHLKSEREYAYHVGKAEGEQIGRLEGEKIGKAEGEKAGLILAFLKVGYPKEKILLELQECYALSQRESEVCFEETLKERKRQS